MKSVLNKGKPGYKRNLVNLNKSLCMNAPSWTYTIFKPDQSSRSFQTVFALSIVYVTFNGTKDLEDFN